MSAIASEYAQHMMERWFAKMKKGNNHLVETDMACDFDELTLTVIARVIYGKNYEDTWELLQLLQEAQKLAMAAFIDPPIRWFRYISSI